MFNSLQQERDHDEAVQFTRSKMTEKQKSGMYHLHVDSSNYDRVFIEKHVAHGVSLSASASPSNLLMYWYVGTFFINTSDYNTFGCKINSNCKNELNKSNAFNHESIGSNHNESIESNYDGESSNKSLKFDDKSKRLVCSDELNDKNARSTHNSAGIFDPMSTNTTHVRNEIQIEGSTSTVQDRISNPVSRNKIHVEDEN